MYKGLYISASGSMMQERRLNMVSNNIANINNTGYKSDFGIFESFIPPATIVPDTAYVSISSQGIDYLQGAMIQTGDPLDVAIEGEGFFSIQTPEGVMYTRKGDFTLDKNRKVVTQNGNIVLGNEGEIAIPKGKSISINEKGRISVKVGRKVTAVDSFRIVNISKPYPLEKAGNGLFRPIDDLRKLPVNFKDTSIRQGLLEGSNVNAVSELVEMINISRAYESYQKVMRSIDEINSRAVTEIARVG